MSKKKGRKKNLDERKVLRWFMNGKSVAELADIFGNYADMDTARVEAILRKQISRSLQRAESEAS